MSGQTLSLLSSGDTPIPLGETDRILLGFTPKQKRLMDFIIKHMVKKGISPSYDDMMRGMKMKSKSGIHRLVSDLVHRGALVRDPIRRGLYTRLPNMLCPCSLSNYCNSFQPMALMGRSKN